MQETNVTIPQAPAVSSTHPTLSAVVLTYNESARLAECLKSLTWADEIVVVDGFSTDDTVTIARRFTPHIYQSDLLGPSNPFGFSDQRNFALERATGDWVLFIDADERVSTELAGDIRRRLDTWAQGTPVAFRMRRREHFFGVESPYTHGQAWQTRLIRRGQGQWDKRAVHESLQFNGPVGDLDGFLLHFSKDTIEQYVRTMNSYTSAEAREAFARNPKPPATPLPSMMRNALYRYIHLRSYREGTFGLLMSIMFAFYSFLTWAKHWELAKNANPNYRPDRPGLLTRAFCSAAGSLWRSCGSLRRKIRPAK